MRIRTRRMRKIRSPHDAVDADFVAKLAGQGIVDDADEDVFVDVRARTLPERRQSRKLLDAVDAVLEDRQPRRVVLGEKYRELREAVEDAAENEFVREHRGGFAE